MMNYLRKLQNREKHSYSYVERDFASLRRELADLMPKNYLEIDLQDN